MARSTRPQNLEPSHAVTVLRLPRRVVTGVRNVASWPDAFASAKPRTGNGKEQTLVLFYAPNWISAHVSRTARL